MSSFVVTTSIETPNGDSTRTQVWESSKPLALGHPFRWILERTESGVRLRYLGGELGRVETGSVRELTHAQLEQGAQIEIAPYQLKIRPVDAIRPAYEAEATGSTLTVYHCLDHFLIESRHAGRSYTPKFKGDAPFTLQQSASGYTLQARLAGLRLSGTQNREVQPGDSLELSLVDLAGSTLSFTPQGSEIPMIWRFAAVDAPEFVDRHSLNKSVIELEDSAWFKKAIQVTAAGFIVLLALSWIWPKPKEDPKVLIPEQYTRIVMEPQHKKAAGQTSSESGAPSVAQNAPKKVRQSAVVQAFRAKALNNAISGLLRGGMTRLLAQSDFVAGRTHVAEARKLFDVKSNALKTTAPLGRLGGHNIQVAALGGDAHGIAGATVGYGKGDRASVKGQGKGFTPFISADASGSQVDQGLTKDEVGEVIHRHLSEVRYCYEAAMIRTPDIEGKLVTDFTINGQGIVKTAEVKNSTLPDPRLDDCIIRRLATWKFPKPRGGVDVSVTYPFIFKTLGR